MVKLFIYFLSNGNVLVIVLLGLEAVNTHLFLREKWWKKPLQETCLLAT